MTIIYHGTTLDQNLNVGTILAKGTHLSESLMTAALFARMRNCDRNSPGVILEISLDDDPAHPELRFQNFEVHWISEHERYLVSMLPCEVLGVRTLDSVIAEATPFWQRLLTADMLDVAAKFKAVERCSYEEDRVHKKHYAGVFVSATEIAPTTGDRKEKISDRIKRVWDAPCISHPEMTVSLLTVGRFTQIQVRDKSTSNPPVFQASASTTTPEDIRRIYQNSVKSRVYGLVMGSPFAPIGKHPHTPGSLRLTREKSGDFVMEIVVKDATYTCKVPEEFLASPLSDQPTL